MAAIWTVLGAGSILPRAGFGCSGHALSDTDDPAVTLFDCGPGTLRSLANSGIELARVERVVLSHFHPDHCLDVLALAFARRNPSFRGVPDLELIGPRGLADFLRLAADLYGGRAYTRFDCAHVREVDPGVPDVIDARRFRLSWTATGHTPEAVAWRVDRPDGRSVTYTGDSGEDARVAALARGTSLFVCECSFPDDRAVPHHLTPTSAGRMALAANCERLLLTHFYPSLDPERARAVAAQVFRGPIEIARDGSRHTLDGRPPARGLDDRGH
ncbi:MAG: MBL fold metallo-hydrolase [Planctomycetota bacterium]